MDIKRQDEQSFDFDVDVAGFYALLETYEEYLNDRDKAIKRLEELQHEIFDFIDKQIAGNIKSDRVEQS